MADSGMSAMLLHQLCDGSVIIATMELLNVAMYLDRMTSRWHQYDIIVAMVIDT